MFMSRTNSNVSVSVMPAAASVAVGLGGWYMSSAMTRLLLEAGWAVRLKMASVTGLHSPVVLLRARALTVRV